MSKRKRLLYIISTLLLAFVISYACFTGCNLPELPEDAAEESAEPSAGGDSP